MKKSEVGKIGEEKAREHLKKLGCFIVENNFWRPWGELDIIARSKDGTLVFVEVKTMIDYGGSSALKPEDNLTKAKLQKLKRTASLYAGSHPELVSEKRGWRLDLITVLMKNDLLTDSQENCEIRHWENIAV